MQPVSSAIKSLRLINPSVDQWPMMNVASVLFRPGTSNQGSHPAGCVPGAPLWWNSISPSTEQ